MSENMEKKRLRHLKNASIKHNRIALIKLERGCMDCGYNSNAFALEFDHLPGSDRSRTVASLTYASWERIWIEIEKCEVVCANCHAIRTANRGGWGMKLGDVPESG